MNSATRRFVNQSILPIGVIVLLVAGTTFVYQLTNRDAEPLPAASANAPSARLAFPVTNVEVARDFALYAQGHCNFWFHNPQQRAIELGLVRTNCECTGVEMSLFSPEAMPTPEDWTQFQSSAVGGRASTIGVGVDGLQGALVRGWMAEADLHRRLGEKLRWQALDQQHSARVPSGATGLLRINWEAKKLLEQTDKLLVELWTRPAGGSETRTIGPQITIPMRFVRPVRLEPESTQFDAGVVGYGRTPVLRFACWSSTLPHFEVKARADSPCLVVVCKPLTGENAVRLAQVARQRDTEVLCAYEVEVTVHDHLGNAQLDLGPFRQAVHFSGDVPGADSYPVVSITGVVKGDVNVTAPGVNETEEVENQIVLGSFRADKPKAVRARVEAQRPGVVVSLPAPEKRFEPSSLKDILEVRLVERKAEGGNGSPIWDLEVRIPANRLHGPLPERSAIRLNLGSAGMPQRGIRIPISGRAFTPLRVY
jgi:hypothetical protein